MNEEEDKYQPLIEKYRPKRLDDIYGQGEIVKRLKVYVIRRNFPHLLFSGNPGTGKTTSAIALTRELFGDEWAGNFLELNASDERGIQVVREKIKNYAKSAPLGDFKFKVIFLDEADALTPDAQAALRRTIERYTASCKFILSCNYSSKIIEPIQSRCAVFRFKGISPVEMKRRLRYIADQEKIKIREEALDAITYVSDFDLRKAINTLEVASLIGSEDEDSNENGIEISIDGIYKSNGYTNPANIVNLINSSLLGNFNNAIDRLDILMIDEGLAGLDVLKQMFKEVMKSNIDEKMKIEIIDRIGETDFRISEGSDERIQMKCLLVQIMRIAEDF